MERASSVETEWVNVLFVERLLNEGFFCINLKTQCVLLAKVFGHEILVS